MVVLSVDLNAGPVNAGTPVSVNLSNVDNVVGIANYGKAVINKGLDAAGMHTARVCLELRSRGRVRRLTSGLQDHQTPRAKRPSRCLRLMTRP